jgi:hypothetical protein
VAGATCEDGPIDLIAGSIACMDVLTGRRVVRPTTVGTGGPELGGTGVAGATGAHGPIDLIAGSIACTDVLTVRRVACPTTAGTSGHLSDFELASTLGGDNGA